MFDDDDDDDDVGQRAFANDIDSDEGESFDWSFSLREDPKSKQSRSQPPPKKTRKSPTGRQIPKAVKVNTIREGDQEILVLSD